MKIKNKIAGILVLVMIYGVSFSQQVDGHWYGVGMIDATKGYTNYMSELVLKQKGKTVSGILNYYFRDTLMKVPVNGSYDAASRKLRIKPFQMIYFLSPSAKNSIDVKMDGDFTLVASKTESILSGFLLSDVEHRRTTPPINFRFQRSTDTTALVLTDEEPEEAKTETVTPAPVQKEAAPAVQQDETTENFAKRSKVFTKTIEVENNLLRLEIYDNGEIDGDVVALYLNNKKILPSSGLTHRAIRLTIQLDPNLEYNEVSMFAENLGRVPPNTAALVIYDGATKYETLLTSDLSKSASIKIIRKK